MNCRSLIVPVTVLTATLTLNAQSDPLSTEASQAWTRTKNNIIAAAEKMPEEHFGFKPAPESQSFRDLVAHTADAAMRDCSAFNGEAKQAGAASKTAKADLVAVLHTAMAECDKAYSSLSDAKASEMIETRRGRVSRLGSLYRNAIHIEHEYAQMAVHLRFKGIVPPSSEGRGGPGKGKQQ